MANTFQCVRHILRVGDLLSARWSYDACASVVQAHREVILFETVLKKAHYEGRFLGLFSLYNSG